MMTRYARRRVLRGFGIAYLVLLAASFVVRHTRTPGPRLAAEDRVATVPAVRGITPLASQVRIVYRDYQPPDGSRPKGTIVMLHGSPGNKRDFRRIGPMVAERYGYRVIAPDLPGFGGSSLDLPDYSFLAGAVYVRELMDQLAVADAHLVGYSMGGGDVLHLADLNPARVRSVTMLSALGVQEMELLGEYHVNHSVHGFQLGALWLLRELTPHFGLLDGGMLPYARNFYDSDQRPLQPILERLPMPMLIIHGTDDVLVPYEVAVEHHRLVPQSELLTVDHGNHFMPFLKPAFLAERIGDFARRVDAGTALTRAGASPERVAAAARPFDPATLPKARGITAVVWTGLLASATFVSEDLTGVAAGVLAAQGRLSFLLAVIGCFVGIVAGDLLLFLAGRYIGRPVVEHPPVSWLIGPQALERSSAWLSRRGAAVVMFSRFVPGMRLPTYLAAGVLQTSVWQFLGWFLFAAAIWTPLLVGAAALGGAGVLRLARMPAIPPVIQIVLAVVVVTIGLQLAVSAATWRGRRLLLSRWRRLTRWEFWPPWVFYPPVFAYIVGLMVKHRSATAFTAANPAIPAGGFIGESKIAILRGLAGAGDAVARATLIESGWPGERRADEVRRFMEETATGFPIVLKPDRGQRGSGVIIVRSHDQLRDALEATTVDTIVQEYVAGHEFGVFYYRHPGESRGRIFSITEKRMPHVTGDGRRTLEELILADERAVCMASVYCERHRERLLDVPAEGETVRLVELGTHCRGAMFLDGWWAYSDALAERFDEIGRTFDGFNFGRFDVRTTDVERFRRGEAFKIIELNGVTSEATHIYDPRTPLRSAYGVLMRQWRIAFDIGAAHAQRGAPTTSIGTLVALTREYQRMSRGHLSSPSARDARQPMKDAEAAL